MKRLILKYLILIFLLSALPLMVWGQINSLHTTSKKALKKYNEAKNFYFMMDYRSAAETIEEVVREDPDFIEAQLLKAEINSDLKNRDKSIEAYKAVIRIDSTFYPNSMYNLGRLEFLSGQYEQALKHLTSFLQYKNNDPRVIKKAKRDIINCHFAIEGLKHPVDFHPVNLGNSVNSAWDEYWPSLTADGQTLVITVLVPGKKYRMGNFEQTKYQEDFYVTHRSDTGWLPRKPLGAPINSPQNEGAQTLSADGNLMYFTACNRIDGMGRCDIYRSYKGSRGWTTPEDLGPFVDSKHWEAQPSLSADGKTLYFVSNRPGGFGKMDIWYSRLKKGRWQPPVNIGDRINTGGNEMSPFIHSDNQTLYFSSDGHPGFGGFDLFISRRLPDSSWSAPRNLGYPINTHGDEIGLIVNAKGDMAYFSSNREKGRGKDIYAFRLYKAARPHFVTYMKGKVYDEVTHRPLTAHIILISLEDNKTVMDIESNRNGNFLMCIPTNRNYALNVSKEGYLFYSDHFPLKGVHEIEHPYVRDVPLKPIQVGQQTVLRNIFFEFDSYRLKPESITELEQLRSFLLKYPKLKVEIGGHTDSKGTEQYNQALSTQRARVVYEYLTKHGIDKNRLTYKGYGESRPIQSNATDKGRAANRRTEIKVTGM